MYSSNIKLPTNDPMISKALLFAYNAHHGQKDKAHIPYIFHPYNVACDVMEMFQCFSALRKRCNVTACVVAALLHDVVEDTNISLQFIEQEFGPLVSTIVKLLTKGMDESSDEYYQRIQTNTSALIVKICDLRDNMRPDRILNTAKKDIERTARYYVYHERLMQTFEKLIGEEE